MCLDTISGNHSPSRTIILFTITDNREVSEFIESLFGHLTVLTIKSDKFTLYDFHKNNK